MLNHVVLHYPADKKLLTLPGEEIVAFRSTSHKTCRSANTLKQSDIGEAVCMAKVKEGNVVRNFKIGNTRVIICDDYCRDKTPDEVNAILARIACRAQERLSALAATQSFETV